MKMEKKPEVYWTLLSHEGWSLYVAATSEGLCFVGSQDYPWDELSAWVSQRFPGSKLTQDDVRLQPYVTELIAYLDGEKDRFSIPLDVRGTPFQRAVWEALCQIPFGQTRTYSDIAAQIQKPAAVRAVGAAIGANPVLICVPCHRVIGKNGTLTGYRGGMEMKEVLLSHEGSALRV